MVKLSSSLMWAMLVQLACWSVPLLAALTFDKVEVHKEGVHSFQPYPNENGSYASPKDEVELSQGQRTKRQGKGQGADSRSFIDIDVGPGLPIGASPLCFEREVYGTCRYRTSPDECFRHEWTAYATIVNSGFIKITSVPHGLVVFPKGHARVRVFLKQSCCNPIVQFVAHTDLFLESIACIVDVRELQDLHPGEIAGIVVGSLLFVIILIVLIALCVRRRRQQRMEKETVIFGRSLTRSKSTSTPGNQHR